MDPSPFSYAYEDPLRCAKYIKWNTNYGTEVVDTTHSSFNSNEVWARYGSMQVVRPKVLQSWQSKFLVCLVTENLEFRSDFIGVNSLLNYVYQVALRRRELVAGMRSGAAGRSRGRGDKIFKLPFFIHNKFKCAFVGKKRDRFTDESEIMPSEKNHGNETVTSPHNHWHTHRTPWPNG